MNNERLQKLRERANEAVKVAARIEEIRKVSPGNVASVLSRSNYGTDQSDLQAVWMLGKAAFIDKLEAELESLIAVEPAERIQEPTKEPEEKYDPASRISDPDTMVGCG